MVSCKKITIRKRNIVVFKLRKILFVIQLGSFCWRSSDGCRRYFKNQTLYIYYICINSKSIQVCYGCFDLAELIILKKLKITDYTYKANAWVNINQKGGYNSIHHHGEFHLSGVYYVKNPMQDNDNGKIEFINSRNDYNIHKVIGGNAFSTSIRVKPKEGFMIIFPSSLLHLVHPNNTNEDRISIAWNIKFEKKIS